MVQGRVVASGEDTEDCGQLARTPRAAALLGPGGFLCLGGGHKAEEKEQRQAGSREPCPKAHFHSSFACSVSQREQTAWCPRGALVPEEFLWRGGKIRL